MASANLVQPIVVFDSGVGGLSVLSHLRAALPDESFRYVMDDAWCPYGDKSDQQLSARVLSVIGCVIRQCRPKMVVIACNTASTLALELLRQKFAIPFVGVVPALKTATEKTSSGSVVLLATEATIQRSYVDQLWLQFGDQRRLIKVACPSLVTIAEEKLRGKQVALESFESLFQQIKRKLRQDSSGVSGNQTPDRVSAFVLGCTHFPLLREELSGAWGESCLWLDSGAAIARRVGSLVTATRAIHQSEVAPLSQASPSVEYWHTHDTLDLELSAALERLQLSCSGRLSLAE